jgi:hypothetical protein
MKPVPNFRTAIFCHCHCKGRPLVLDECGERSDVRSWRCCHHLRVLAVTHYRRLEVEGHLCRSNVRFRTRADVRFWRKAAELRREGRPSPNARDLRSECPKLRSRTKNRTLPFRPNLVAPRPASDSQKRSSTKLGCRLQSDHPGRSVQTAPPLRSGRSAQIGLRNFETH